MKAPGQRKRLEIQAIRKRRLKIGLLGASLGTDNLGVSALAAGAVRCILHRFPQAEVFFLDYRKESCTHHLALEGQRIGIPIVNMRFSKKFYLANHIAPLILFAFVLKLIFFQKLRHRLIAGNACLRHIHGADLIASIAGGDSFSDIYGLGRLFYVALPQFLVLLLGKRLVLLPQTIGPFRARFSRAIARFILNRAERVYSRDFQGVPECEALARRDHKKGQFSVCYDVGFVLEPAAPPRLDVAGLALSKPEGSALVGLNVSGLLYMGGYTRNNMFGLKANYKEILDPLIELLIRNRNANVLLVPHVFGDAQGSESDLIVCRKIYEDLKDRYSGRIGLVRGRYNQSEIKFIIGKCDFFVGSRMHACIAAISQNIPAVAIAYSDKFVGVMQTVGVESLVADARILDHRQILDLVQQAFERREVLRRQLEHIMPQLQQTVLNLLNEMNGFPQSERPLASTEGELPAHST